MLFFYRARRFLKALSDQSILPGSFQVLGDPEFVAVMDKLIAGMYQKLATSTMFLRRKGHTTLI